MPKPDRLRPGIGEETLFEEYMLRRAARSRIETERQTADGVALALAAGLSWTRIGHLLGMPVAVAQRRYEFAGEQAMGA